MRRTPAAVINNKSEIRVKSKCDGIKVQKSRVKLSRSFADQRKSKNVKRHSLPASLDQPQSPERKRRKNQLEKLQSSLSPEYIGFGVVTGKRSRYGRAQKLKEDDDFLPTQIACYVRRTPPKVKYVAQSNGYVQKIAPYESPIEKLIKKNKMLANNSSRESTESPESEKDKEAALFKELGISTINNNEPTEENNDFLDFNDEPRYSGSFLPYLKSPSSHSTDSAKGSSIDLEIDFPVQSGDIFWARISPFPYWPCIVWPDPNGRTIVLNNNKVQRRSVKIHVRFFGDNGRRSWVHKSNMLPYSGREDFDKRGEEFLRKFGKKHSISRAFEVNMKKKFTWEKAVAEADEVSAHPNEDRQRIFDMVLEKSREMMTTERLRRRQSVTESRINNSLLNPDAKIKRERSPGIESEGAPHAEAQVKRVKMETSFGSDETTAFNIENSSDDTHLFDDEEYTLFYELIRLYILNKKNPTLEKHLQENVRKIWRLRRLSQGTDERRSTMNIRKLGARLRELSKSPPAPPKKTMQPENRSDSAKSEKKGSKLIEEVIEDIMELGKNYLFKGLSKESVCKDCHCPSNLVKCSGNCQSLIHKDCNNSSRSVHVTGDLEEYRVNMENSTTNNQPMCSECSSGEFPKCFVCKKHEEGTGNIIKCHVNWCSYHYHIECLKYWPQSKITKSSAKIESLLCPSHVCHTCVSDDPRGKFFQIDKSKLVRCVECPATYHSDSFCIPAGTKFLTATQIVCPRHGKHDKLNVNANWCFICAAGGRLICCDTCPTAFHLECLKIPQPDGNYICEECETGRLPLYGEMVWAKLGNYRWWPAIIIPPPEVPKNLQTKKHESSEFCIRFFGTNDHTWINRNRVFLYQEGDWGKVSNTKGINQSYKQGLEEAKKISELLKKTKQLKANPRKDKGLAPLPYTKIKFNRPVPPVKLQETDISELTPCDCNPQDEDPCGPYSGCLNRLLMTECNPKVCPAGPKCQNQLFEKRLYPPLKVYCTDGRGWGLICENEIKSGAFIIEYVGEVIDDAEFQRRIAQKQEEKDENYYFLTLEKDYIIDAGPKGNMARFMNHSCEPNCETQKWTVNGLTRIGLFAIKDIPAKTELTFNYNLECLGSSKKICHCGSERCSGFIGSKYKENEKEKSTPKSTSAPRSKSKLKARERRSTTHM